MENGRLYVCFFGGSGTEMSVFLLLLDSLSLNKKGRKIFRQR